MARKKAKGIGKKGISLLLSMVMILTTFCIFDVGSVFSHAAVTNEGNTEDTSTVYLYVPEVIYLRPYSNSWRDYTQSDFQFYIQNTVVGSDGKLVAPDKVTAKADYDTTGMLYYKGPSITGLSYKWLSKDAGKSLDTTGATVTLGATTQLSGTSDEWQCPITGGISPYLYATFSEDQSQDETGCYLEWTVTYQDTDGEEKAVTAYTYVYKPYTVPVGSVQGEKYKYATSIFSTYRQPFMWNVSWLSGFHKVAATADEATTEIGTNNGEADSTTRTAGYPRYEAGNNNGSMGGFLSTVSTKINDTDDATGKQAYWKKDAYASYAVSNNGKAQVWSEDLVKNMYAIYASDTDSNRYMSSTPEQVDGSDYLLTTSSSTNSYDIKTFYYSYLSESHTNKSKYMDMCMENDHGGVAGIYIDTSRYNNLAEIPNLGVGLMQTKQETERGPKSGCWMVGDFTDLSDSSYFGDYYHIYGNYTDVFENVNWYMGAVGYPNKDQVENGLTNCNTTALKYAGSWYRPLITNVSEKTYKVKSVIMCSHDNKGESSATFITMSHILSLKAYQTDKSALRAAVNSAMAKMKDYGAYVENNELKSLYYTAASWSNFVTAYKNAQYGLTLLDGSCNPSALVTALTDAMNNLTLATGTAKQYNVFLDRQSAVTDSTVYRFNTSLTNSKTVSYTAKDNVKFTLESTPAGYNYMTTVKLNTDVASLSGDVVIGTPSNITSDGFPTEYKLNGTKLETTTDKGKTPVTYSSGNINFNHVAAGADSNIIIMNIYYNTRVEFAYNDGGIVNTGSSMANQEFYFNIDKNLTENAFKREYTVTYNGNGGTLNGNASDSCTYTFDGWATNLGIKLSDKATADEILSAGYTTSDTTVNTLTATWTNDQPEYKLAATPTYADHAFAGWYEGETFVGGAGADYVPTKTVTLTAKWVDVSKIPSNDTTLAEAQEEYADDNNVVKVAIGIDENGNALYDNTTVVRYVESERQAYLDYMNTLYQARENYNNSNTLANSQALLAAGSTVVDKPHPNGTIVNTYNDHFYANGGYHSLKEMNLNHYSGADLEKAYDIKLAANQYTDETDSSQQIGLNNQVIAMAKTFVNTQKSDTTAPEFKVSETAESVKAAVADSSELQAAGITADNGAATYVYPGKGNYTYYCYTNSANPTILVSADDVSSVLSTASEGTSSVRTSYPTTATVTSDSAYKTVKVKADNANDYSKYTAIGVGSDMASLYSQKEVVALTPTFTGDTGTATYTISAYDDAASAVADCNKADSATLAAARSSASQSTDANQQITIYVDYKKTTPVAGSSYTMRVVGDQVNKDQWIKQYHLFRTSGGSSNWDWPQKNDGKPYDVVDPIYGQNNNLASCSFAYTFMPGATTNIANNVLNVNTSGYTSYDPNDYTAYLNRADLIESVQNIIKDNAAAVTGSKFTNGLGYFAISSNSWSTNYYPQSGAYTYVHIVDRWGNAFDDVIYVGNLDAIQASVKSGTGTAMISESGGSGINTVSVSGSNIDIVTDSNSSLSNSVYNTTGNTVKLSGEPNTSYTLKIEDKATNTTTATVTSDDNGYIDLTFEDDAYTDGVYTFSLNGIEINLYGEVEKSAIESVTYTPSVSERNTFVAKVNAGDTRVLKVQIIDEFGGTRTYDRNNAKVSIKAYNADGIEVSDLSRDVAYELWTLADINLPHKSEYTAVAIYADWTKDSTDIGCKFTVNLKQDDAEVYSMAFASTSGSAWNTSAEVITGLDVTNVQFVLADGTTQTYSASVNAVESDGKLIFSAPKVWMTQDGLNEITVRVKVAKEWRVAGVLTYTLNQ